MNKGWDDPTKMTVSTTPESGFSGLGLDGSRHVPLPAYNPPFAGANPTCNICGGRARGKKLCNCQNPDWRVKGEKLPEEPKLVAFQRWAEEWLRECLRVLKPGGIIKVFSATRTFHRVGAAMENVGFKQIDLEAWGYGSGFPKSLNIGKALDKMAGAQRKKVALPATAVRNHKAVNGGKGIEGGDRPYMQKARELGFHEIDGNEPVTEAAKQFDGYGSALKPAWEPFLVAQKPVI